MHGTGMAKEHNCGSYSVIARVSLGMGGGEMHGTRSMLSIMVRRQKENTDKYAGCPGTQCTPTECADKLDWMVCGHNSRGIGHFKRDSKNIRFQPVPS